MNDSHQVNPYTSLGMDWHFEFDRARMIAPVKSEWCTEVYVDIRSKLRLSESSPIYVHWVRENGRLRLYQGAVHWALHNGLPAPLECRELKSVRGGRLIFAEYAEQPLLRYLRARGHHPESLGWGWSITLTDPRCFIREQAWVAEQAQRLPARRWRPSEEESVGLEEQLRELMEEVRDWPSADLLPMQALKALRRWQARLQQLLPGKSGQTD